MNIAVIFAGGTGQRMGGDKPKQFLEVYGKPILIHTLDRYQFHQNIDEIFVACKSELIPELESMVKKFGISKIKEGNILPGGTSGQDSIFNGLMGVYNKYGDKNPIVLIHDGVRPIINEEVITANIESVKNWNSAITCTPSFETPVLSIGREYVESLPTRQSIFTAQAPQSFYLNDVVDAHKETRKTNPDYNGIIDTCTLMVACGKKVRIVEGNKGNIKVTTPEDYIDLLARLQAEDHKKIYSLMSSNSK